MKHSVQQKVDETQCLRGHIRSNGCVTVQKYNVMYNLKHYTLKLHQFSSHYSTVTLFARWRGQST